MSDSIFTSGLKLQPHTGPRRLVYAGVPNSTSQNNVHYSIFKNKKDENAKEFRIKLKKGGTIRWKIHPKEDEHTDIKAERLPTHPLGGEEKDDDDLELERKGTMQIHKSSGDEIYGTLQDGKVNSSIRLIRNKDQSGWTVRESAPPKSRGESAFNFVKSIKSKTAEYDVNDNPLQTAVQDNKLREQGEAMNWVTYPLTGDDLLKQTLITGGLGALGGAAYHGFKKLKRKVWDDGSDDEDESSLLADVGTFGLAGAAAPSAWRLGNYWMQPKPMQPYEKVGNDQSAQSIQKEAFGEDLDYRKVIGAIRGDSSISDMEREQLVNMARDASKKRIPIDQQALTNAGFAALAGYIISKLMGVGTLGSAVVGAGMGAAAYMGTQASPYKVYNDGGYTYK